MKLLPIVFFILMFFTGRVFSEPSSQVAWTPETIKFVKNGNPENGKKLAEGCKGCHGEKGISPAPSFPSLAGQLANYTYKQLRDYQDGNRSDRIMTSLAAGLSKQDIADIAVWFSSLPPLEWEENDEITEPAENMVFVGDSKRVLPPCSVCHGTDGRGEVMDVPALTGQQNDYLKKTLNDYKSGERKNDIYSRMRLIVEQLSEEEIEGLAQYYSGKKP
ncbi:MAG: c-type cytochrome [Methylococcales bacterium]